MSACAERPEASPASACWLAGGGGALLAKWVSTLKRCVRGRLVSPAEMQFIDLPSLTSVGDKTFRSISTAKITHTEQWADA